MWCTSQNMWVSAAHIPGTQNTEADSFSRSFNQTIEWKLSTHLFQKISSMFGNPTLDLLASHMNQQIHRHISCKPDPKALTIDAFSIKWNTEIDYIYYIYCICQLVGKINLVPEENLIPEYKLWHSYAYIYPKVTFSRIEFITSPQSYISQCFSS